MALSSVVKFDYKISPQILRSAIAGVFDASYESWIPDVASCKNPKPLSEVTAGYKYLMNGYIKGFFGRKSCEVTTVLRRNTEGSLRFSCRFSPSVTRSFDLAFFQEGVEERMNKLHLTLDVSSDDEVHERKYFDSTIKNICLFDPDIEIEISAFG